MILRLRFYKEKISVTRKVTETDNSHHPVIKSKILLRGLIGYVFGIEKNEFGLPYPHKYYLMCNMFQKNLSKKSLDTHPEKL